MCCTVAAAAGCQIASHGQMKLKFWDDNRQEPVVEVIRFMCCCSLTFCVAVDACKL